MGTHFLFNFVVRSPTSSLISRIREFLAQPFHLELCSSCHLCKIKSNFSASKVVLSQLHHLARATKTIPTLLSYRKCCGPSPLRLWLPKFARQHEVMALKFQNLRLQMRRKDEARFWPTDRSELRVWRSENVTKWIRNGHKSFWIKLTEVNIMLRS